MLAPSARTTLRFASCRLVRSSWLLGSAPNQRSLASSIASPQRRSKRDGKRVTVDVRVAPQGLIRSVDDAENAGEVLSPAYPTVIQQARNNMSKFSHCVVLTRVGSFYELYFEQAEKYGPMLGLKVASKKTSNGPVPMSGFPFFQLDRFLKYLVQDHGKYVAISEETPNEPAQRVRAGGLMHDRQVKRVITPGTLIDEHFLNPYEHNYLLAVDVQPGVQQEAITDRDETSMTQMQQIGLSWLDLSSGDFFTQSIELDNVGSAIARISPREIILRRQDTQVHGNILVDMLKHDEHVITYHMPSLDAEKNREWDSLLEPAPSHSHDDVFTAEESSAAKLLLDYAETQLPGLQLRLQSPIRRHANEYMNVDRNSLRGLEVLRTMRDGLFKGSLLHSVRRTSTESGARLLAYRLTSPSSSYEVINERLDLVEILLNDEALLEQLVSLLRRTSDTLRLVQKFSFGRGDADDLLAVARTISVTQDVSSLLAHYTDGRHASLQRLVGRFELQGPAEVAQRITEAIDEEGLMLKHRNEDVVAADAASLARVVIDAEPEAEDLGSLQKKLAAKRFTKANGDEELPKQDEIWIMRPVASSTLAKLHEKLATLQEERDSLEESLRSQLGASSLTLKWAPGLGHFCHIKGRDITRADLSLLPTSKTVSSSKSTKSFYLSDWTTLGTRIDSVKVRIRTEESHIFQSLRDTLIKTLVPLRRNASLLDELDVSASFARLAAELHLTRPILNHSQETKIFGGRHIMVDAGLTENGKQFTPNDCHLHPAEKIWLITGPNMAGKSTFLRQTALISILAQTGSFVPAAYAEVGLVDQIFSRVGSADNLSQEQSTFMVEMLETAAILRQATSRSFVIMDEVGRGTTPEDGVAVGYAVLKHLREVNGCRALFATHFHALADMTDDWTGNGLGAYCTDVKEEEGGAFRYEHRLRSGVNRHSHALKVARLAGMPEGAITTAREVLEGLKTGREEDSR